jgi:hypothetical protein
MTSFPFRGQSLYLLDPGCGLHGIGFERRDDVYKIKRREVIEVHGSRIGRNAGGLASVLRV